MKILIAFCSITGNNEDISEFVTDMLSSTNECVEKEMKDITLNDVNNSDILICVTSNDDENPELSIPTEALGFYEMFTNKNNFSKKSFISMGSEDRFYKENFCRAVKSFEEILTKNGWLKLTDSILIDQELQTDDKRRIENSLNKLISV